MKKVALYAATALAATLAFGQSQNAQANDPNVNVGALNCSVEGGFGFIIGSNKDMNCTFTPADGGPTEHYRGTIEKAGVDIGWTQDSVIVWGVLAGTNTYNAGTLAGTYGGASAEATIGVGLGANVLFSADNSFALQPVSVSAQTGLNVAGGLTRVNLTFTH